MRRTGIKFNTRTQRLGEYIWDFSDSNKKKPEGNPPGFISKENRKGK